MEPRAGGESAPQEIADGQSMGKPDSQRAPKVTSSTSVDFNGGEITSSLTSRAAGSCDREEKSYRRPGTSRARRAGFEPVGDFEGDSDGRHAYASARRRNGVLPVNDVGKVQEVTEPGATEFEVNAIYRLKSAGRRLQGLTAHPQVQRSCNLLFAVVLSWVVGQAALSLVPGVRNEVNGFLRTVSLTEYADLFAEKGYVTLQDVLLATDDDLRDYVGIDVVPHRRRILALAQDLKARRSILPALFWLSIGSLFLSAGALGVSMVVSAQVRDRVVCVVMFWAFMSWHRVRLWRRLWTSIDVFRSPRVRPKDCQPPTLLEPRRTFTAMNSPSAFVGPGPVAEASRGSTDTGAGPRNGNSRLLNRLKKRRNGA